MITNIITFWAFVGILLPWLIISIILGIKEIPKELRRTKGTMRWLTEEEFQRRIADEQSNPGRV